MHNCTPLPTQKAGKTLPLTNRQATDLAEYLGYRPTNVRIKSQRVFTNGKNYIVQDVDSHNGGTWKVATTVKNLGKKSTRTSTTDCLLVPDRRVTRLEHHAEDYWSLDFPGLVEAQAEQVVAFVRETFGLPGSPIDPSVFLTLHIDRETAETVARGLEVLGTADSLSLSEDFIDWIERYP